jgi:hypothetical protein
VKTYRQWAVTRPYAGGPEQLAEDIRELSCSGQHMMIAGEEHIIGPITQIVALQDEGTTNDVLIVFEVWPLHEARP